MEPGFTRFNPAGITAPAEEVVLTVDEFEAVRLKDLEGLAQEDGAKRMGISQPTFHRDLVSARGKIADALVNGKVIRIEGGDYRIVARGPGRGRGKGRGGPPR
jgi:predicted DNA-binding protein (UPF0251 family)